MLSLRKALGVHTPVTPFTPATPFTPFSPTTPAPFSPSPAADAAAGGTPVSSGVSAAAVAAPSGVGGADGATPAEVGPSAAAVEVAGAEALSPLIEWEMACLDRLLQLSSGDGGPSNYADTLSLIAAPIRSAHQITLQGYWRLLRWAGYL